MTTNLSLDGMWQVGDERRYDAEAPVPGLARDAARMGAGALWYRRAVALSGGDWTHATLTLQGARFCPAVYVDGREVSRAAGGMAPTQHLLSGDDVRPGGEITLEVALASLADVPREDASRIPEADWWRSNVSSCLWDGVRLRLHGPARLTRLVPLAHPVEDRVEVAWRIERLAQDLGPLALRVRILDGAGRSVAEGAAEDVAGAGVLPLSLGNTVRRWSPESPTLYTLRADLLGADGRPLDRIEHPWGLKRFAVDGLGFRLNGDPVTLRAGTVVWHRWVRDPEARALAFDEDWFEEHVVRRLKGYGANALRFHLGMPPEALLDLCDRHGLLVQAEWSFFHGIAASHASLVAQWRDWFDLLMRHPSVAIIHPWNESHGEEVHKAMAALDEVAIDYPPLVVAHRDVIHVHKYWWSLFENLGLYYDSAAQFDHPIVADEFGGNYLDGNGDPGGYPTLRGALLRFLGRGHTRDQRLTLHTEANSQVAEYWRRLGAAGFSPFCILGSPEDGNHHFLGPLAEGRPKPVWDALAAAYAPWAASLEVWDRNFRPGQRVSLPVWFPNDTLHAADLMATVGVWAEGEEAPRVAVEVSCSVPPHGREGRTASLVVPEEPGEWRFSAVLRPWPAGVDHPVVSSWRFRTLAPRALEALTGEHIALVAGEEELADFLSAHALIQAPIDDPTARLIVGSRRTWETLAEDEALRRGLGEGLLAGRSVVLLDVGPRFLGQGYLEGGALGPLDGVMRVDEPRVEVRDLFLGLRATFRELPEPESCVHPAASDVSLWAGLPREATWLWNGLRGGLVAPAADMELAGLSPEAFVALWAGRGADPARIVTGTYQAHELAGHYAFSAGDDPAAREDLRRRVRFLVEDAPALAAAINPEAPIRTYDLAAAYRASAGGAATGLTPLASCGMNLLRTPVIEVAFGPGRGRLLLSQLLTAGRLAAGYGEPGLYGLRRDPAAEQCVLNMLARALVG